MTNGQALVSYLAVVGHNQLVCSRNFVNYIAFGTIIGIKCVYLGPGLPPWYELLVQH